MERLINNLKIWQKFALIGALALGMVAIPTALVVDTELDALNTARAEAAGMAPSAAVIKLIQVTQQHRGLSAGFLGGNESLGAARQRKRAEVDEVLVQAKALAAGLDEKKLAARAENILRDWQALAGAVNGKAIAAPESNARHAALIAAQLGLLEDTVDTSTLALDPEAGTYYMIVSVLGHLPKLTESLGQVRASGAALLSRGEALPEDKLRLNMPMNMARYHAQLVQSAFGKAVNADPELKKIIDAPLAAALAAVENGLKLANDKIVLAEKPNFPSAEYIAAMTKVINTQFDLIGVALPALDLALADRVKAKQYGLMKTTGLIGALAALVLWIIVLVTRTTVRSMGHAVKVAQTVAAGDLTSRIDVTSSDETGQLLQALKGMNDSLIKIVGEVRGGADTIVSASGQIATDNQHLASRTEEQASALAETASSMEQLTATVKQNADNAHKANDLAVSASEVAIKGGSVVSQVVGTMTSINESSKKIVDIIGVIDGIAFQTNILALNAAVEAARAGEQGRGFAVVASEVRNLAQRSAAAAKEIKTLIGDSVGKVDAGSKLVDQAGATMHEIVTSIRRVTDIMADITSASQEQHAGIEHVNQAIAQMDKTTQQNAVLVEEAATAAQSMQYQAGNLVQVVGVFKA